MTFYTQIYEYCRIIDTKMRTLYDRDIIEGGKNA